MKWIIAFLMLASASLSIASTGGLSCTVSGSDLVNANDLSARYVGTASPVTLTSILKEDEGSGTYMTYVKVNVTYNPKSKLPMALSAVSSFTDVMSIEMKGAYTAEMKVRSRVDRAPLSLKIECAQSGFDYLLNPAYDQQQDPLDATQNAAFTLPKLLADLAAGVYYHSPAPSESEFLAGHFCTEGDAGQLFKDLKANRSAQGMWRTSALGDHTLSPQNLRLEENSIRWEQPQETAVCVKSHTEDSVDDDGIPYSVEVCDEYKVDELEPLALEIKSCELK